MIRPDNLCPGAIKYGVMERYGLLAPFLGDGGRSPEDRHSFKKSAPGIVPLLSQVSTLFVVALWSGAQFSSCMCQLKLDVSFTF
jgi:hypothetical protein